jgi:histidinol-phosphate aminotransferase
MSLRTASPAWIYRLDPYVPGKPPEEVERELGIQGALKLASNENPLGPSPRAIEAMAAALASQHLYPDAAAFKLRTALASRLGVDASRILVGNGSAEIIKQLVATFACAGDHAVISQFAFIAYRVSLDSLGVPYTVVPARDLGHDLEAMAAACSERTRLVFVANPNNPTGTVVPRGALQSFLRAVPEHVLVVLDEAYFEYLDDPAALDGMSLLAERENLIVLRTFSKAYGLAGLRVGYGVAPTYVAERFNRARDAFNVNALAQIAAIAAWEDIDFVQHVARENREARSAFCRDLSALGLEYVPSSGNFVLIRSPFGGPELFQRLLRQGIITRPLAPYAMPDHLRISIGTREHMARCAEALRAVVG